jgi:hypothetical protein
MDAKGDLGPRFAAVRHEPGAVMRLATPLIATMAVAFEMVPALYTDDAAKPADKPKTDESVNSTTAASASAKPKPHGKPLLLLPAVSSRQTPPDEGIGNHSEKCVAIVSLSAQNPPQTRPAPAKTSSYMPVVEAESFAIIQSRMNAAKAAVMKQQMNLLAERYDLNCSLGSVRCVSESQTRGSD